MQSEARPGSAESGATPHDFSWAEVKTLFEAALSRPEQERNDFLERACAENQALLEQVRSLLDNHDETESFLERPIVSVSALVANDLDPTVVSETPIGTRIGAYRLVEQLGQGGMGEVYLAVRADSEFDKRVAIKLIRSGFADPAAISRFRRERQILAQLENSYIARLLDGGTTNGGLPYFVMEYVEGKPITVYCDQSSYNIRDRLNLFLKVCSAVQYAHERNIVHRDLKPGNILVKKDGTPKLLDFGIAKIVAGEDHVQDPDLTHHNFRVLTPGYASPEQLQGEKATVRSDIYSLGVVLHELLCDKRPDPSYFNSLHTGWPCTQQGHLSPQLRAILVRSLHPDPNQRYASVAALTTDLRFYLSGAPGGAAILPYQDDGTAKASLAILPFRILGDQHTTHAFLAPGITETLITRLSRIERLSISPPSAVLKYAGGVEAVRAARELHVQYILEGALQMFGQGVRATVQLVFAEAGIAVWAGQVEATEQTLPQLEDSIAEQVAAAVLPHLTGEERQQISRSGTTSGAAHAAYLRGRWLWANAGGDQEKLLKALICFTQATEIDPKFARAHAGIADYYLRLGLWGALPPAESFAAAVKAAQTAVDLEPTLGEAHASLAFSIWAYSGDELAAEKHFSLAVVRNPVYASTHHWFGLLNSARNRPELAIANLERAQKVDPHSAVIAAALGFVYYNARQFDQALELVRNAARELPDSGIIHEMLTWCYLQTGDVSAALDSAGRAALLSNRSSASLSALAHAQARAGNLEGALSLRKEVEERTRRMYVSSHDRASLALAVNNTKDAIHFLEQARAEQDWWVCWIEVDPRWDPLRNEARFRKLLPQRDPGARRPRVRPALIASACAAALTLAFGAWWFARPHIVPFANVKFTKLTSDGTAESAVISPDGTSVVYAARTSSGMTLWRRDINTRQGVKLVDGGNELLGDLGFTKRGSAVQFVTAPLKDPNTRKLFLVALAGGAASRVPGSFPGPVSFSNDGRSVAYFISNQDEGADELMVLDTNSGRRRMLASYKYPSRLAWNCRPSWSSDGTQIAVATEDKDQNGFLVRLHVIHVGSLRRDTVDSPRWQWVQSIAWTHNDKGLVVVGQEHESSFQQIWYLRHPGSRDEARRIGNDLDDYNGATLNSAGSEIVSVQTQTLSNIFVAKPPDFIQARQLTVGNGRYFDISWLPNQKILYASDATGSADLWAMNADGTGQHQITAGNGRNYGPAASPDGRLVTFHSNRSGNWQVWSINADGSSPKQISSSVADGNWPQFSKDGQSILFHRSSATSVFNLWQVPAHGGNAKLFTTSLTMHPTVSRTTGQVAAWYSDKVDAHEWRIAIFSPGGGAPLRTLTATPFSRPDTPIRWTPKSDGIATLDYAHSTANIWIVPADGRPPYPLTSFQSGEIFSFDWTPDGELLYSRGLTTSDVVLIRDVNASRKSK